MCVTSFLYDVQQNQSDFVDGHDAFVLQQRSELFDVVFDLFTGRVRTHHQVLATRRYSYKYTDRLIDRVKVLSPTRRKTGHFGDVLHRQCLGLILKKLNLPQ